MKIKLDMVTLQLINNGSPDTVVQWKDVIDPEPAVGSWLCFILRRCIKLILDKMFLFMGASVERVLLDMRLLIDLKVIKLSLELD